jgi:hypothetical protein
MNSKLLNQTTVPRGSGAAIRNSQGTVVVMRKQRPYLVRQLSV